MSGQQVCKVVGEDIPWQLCVLTGWLFNAVPCYGFCCFAFVLYKNGCLRDYFGTSGAACCTRPWLLK